MFRGVNPVLLAAQVAQVGAGDREGAVQGQLLDLSRTRRPSCAISSSPTSIRSSRGATPIRCAARCRCSSRRWTACSNTRATADVLIGVTKGDPATAGRYPVADYRSWLIGRFPGGAAGVRRRARARHGARLARFRARAAHARSPQRRPCAARGTAGRLLLRRLPVARVGRRSRRRTSRGCRSLPDPVTQDRVAVVDRDPPETARRLGIENGDHLKVDTAAGSVTAPAYIYLGVRPDVVAMATGRGHTSYGRYAQNIGVNALDALPVAHDAAGGLRSRPSRRASPRRPRTRRSSPPRVRRASTVAASVRRSLLRS